MLQCICIGWKSFAKKALDDVRVLLSHKACSFQNWKVGDEM